MPSGEPCVLPGCVGEPWERPVLRFGGAAKAVWAGGQGAMAAAPAATHPGTALPVFHSPAATARSHSNDFRHHTQEKPDARLDRKDGTGRGCVEGGTRRGDEAGDDAGLLGVGHGAPCLRPLCPFPPATVEPGCPRRHPSLQARDREEARCR